MLPRCPALLRPWGLPSPGLPPPSHPSPALRPSGPLPQPFQGICALQLPRPQAQITGSWFWRGAWEAEAATGKACGSGNLGGSWPLRSAHRPFPLLPRGGAWWSPLGTRRPCFQDWLPEPSRTPVGKFSSQGLPQGGRSVGWEQFDHTLFLPTSLLKAAVRAHRLLVQGRWDSWER